jgi:flagellar basal-body rod protein FlgG
MVEGEEGPVLQRSGNFTINNEGQLVNQRGQRVMTEGGALEIPDRERMIIDQNGVVRTDEGGEIGRLRLVDTEAVSPIGHGQWRAEGPLASVNEEIQVLQGALEKSNVDPIRGMVELMEASRYFETYQKAMQTTDELDGRANEMMRSK